MSLKQYSKKRNLKKSGEPSVCARNDRGAKNKRTERGHEQEPKIKTSGKNIYLIQEHHATRLHWDLRLEMKGTLKSWALPKTPPKIKNLKRLAIQVEDHPLDYANFQGEIKDGYGKGTVKIWDKGAYEIVEKDKEKIEFQIHGKKLKGKYVLVNAKLGGEKKNWLFFKV
jgi:DNA ligase D-like protein (predicted 3'-phosphoesterase)